MAPEEWIEFMRLRHAECIRERRKHMLLLGLVAFAEATMVVLCVQWGAEKEDWHRWIFYPGAVANAWGCVRTCRNAVETWRFFTKVERQMRAHLAWGMAEFERIKRIGGEV